jgi:SagB-type dehydrogenase family enzyme
MSTREEALQTIHAYHARTCHQPDRYAASLGYLDWATRPEPFRWYDGAERLSLPRAQPPEPLCYDDLFRDEVSPAALNAHTLGAFFYHSLALSAWKQIAGVAPWPLRVNPSSGNLHPTEAYVIAGPVASLSSNPALYHYQPYLHALERRAELPAACWHGLAAQLPAGCLLIGLTSIIWREAWKYGERAFRYCQHDVGHAIGALAFAARLLGWQIRLVTGLPPAALMALLGVTGQQTGPEAEEPECLLAVGPGLSPTSLTMNGDELLAWQALSMAGTPRPLSKAHHPWPVLAEVAAATRDLLVPMAWEDPPASLPAPAAQVPAAPVIRGRRSALAFDGMTGIDQPSFYALLGRTLPASYPQTRWPWRPAISLIVLVHRVQGLAPGIYLLARHPAHEADLRAHLPACAWQRPADCPSQLPLYLLQLGDVRQAAQVMSCQQDIAAEGAFTVAMLAEFEAVLTRQGVSAYRSLHWEAGLIGQLLYLEAESIGGRATGIGCFFDELLPLQLGLQGSAWQDVYHLALGRPLEDPRLQTIAAYAHLERASGV